MLTLPRFIRPGRSLISRLYGADLATRAKRAWDWATANPSIRYYNNDNAKQPGSAGLAAGQQEMDDAQRLFANFEAAIYLYELTGDASYKDFVESNYTAIIADHGPTQWDADRQEALLYYTGLPRISADVRAAILSEICSERHHERRSASYGRQPTRPLLVTDQRLYLGQQSIEGLTSEIISAFGFVWERRRHVDFCELQRHSTIFTIFTASTHSALFI